MNILIIDTSSRIELVALSTGSGTFSKTAAIDKSHSITLLTDIKKIFADAGLSLADIDLIAAGIGPGSFTGIRIAVSTARMLAQMGKKPLVGIPSQLLYAVSMDAAPGSNILIALDAKKSRVFGALYKKSGEDIHPQEITPPGDYPIDYLAGRVDKNHMTHTAGDGIPPYSAKHLDPAINYRHRDSMVFSIENISRLAADLHEKNRDASMDYGRIVPWYARKSDAELGLEK